MVRTYDCHLLRSWDPLGRPCWILHPHAIPPRLPTRARRAAQYWCHQDEELGALVIEPEGLRAVRKAIERDRAFRSWCSTCLAGELCGIWSTELLAAEGYHRLSDPVYAAACRLGLKAPWTENQVQKAFRARALRVHPDHGGSDQAFDQLVKDRALLLSPAALS